VHKPRASIPTKRGSLIEDFSVAEIESVQPSKSINQQITYSGPGITKSTETIQQIKKLSQKTDHITEQADFRSKRGIC
jgi:hypothetical protein